jgi:transposase
MQRHRHQEFIRFLNALERKIPTGKVVHAILDYAAHKTPELRRWLARHPRWTFHFTPTPSSWLNAVEGFFASRRRLKRGVFCSVVELQAAINRFVQEHNNSPKPFVCGPIPTRPSPRVLEGSKRWSQSTRPPDGRSRPRPDQIAAQSSKRQGAGGGPSERRGGASFSSLRAIFSSSVVRCPASRASRHSVDLGRKGFRSLSAGFQTCSRRRGRRFRNRPGNQWRRCR